MFKSMSIRKVWKDHGSWFIVFNDFRYIERKTR